MKDTRPPILDSVSARCAVLIRRTHAFAAGDDRAWDSWASLVIERKGLGNNASAAMPLVTDAFLRGVQFGLKAHLPVDPEILQDATAKFGRISLKAYARQECARAFTALGLGDNSGVNEACRNGEKALDSLGAPA